MNVQAPRAFRLPALSFTSIASKLAPTRYVIPVGASLLAMDVNDNAGCLSARGVWSTIASRLAPTGEW
ncbi:hypothetical protein DKY63_30865 [Pseudomonas putida]|uniref:Uncharacterized protein n=1 Tax=Pseudomonas putida TaxID=303 RepID=A0A2Z4RTS2_PSEPU|nr:hypothetical protein DKY63_30865 [Pseudomonas putida]